jgi:PIN domain nuclease of toxin-antitoxin system
MQNGSGLHHPLLIDTHYWLWLAGGDRERLTSSVINLLQNAADHDGLLVSAISVWEIAMLDAKGRVQLFKTCTQWVDEALAISGLTLAPLSPAIAIESNHLPGGFHGDPADRIIVATARVLGARLLTNDKSIRAYAAEGHVLLT